MKKKSKKEDQEIIYHAEEIPDDTEELVRRFRENRIRMREEVVQDRRNRNLVEAIKELTQEQRDAILGNLRTLIVFVKNGKVFYTGNAQYKTYEATFNPSGNNYKLLILLAGMPGKEFSSKEIAKVLNSPRRGAEDSSPERRVSDTIKDIKKELQISEEDNFFTRNNNMHGINCRVELNPS